MAKTIKLYESETDLLLKASAGRNGTVRPFPESDGATAAKLKKRVGRLIVAGLMEERPTSSVGNAWRTEASGQHYALRITQAGRAALQASPADAQPETPQPRSDTEAVVPSLVEPPGKLGAILSAVRQLDGAAMSELVTLTGWQPHTVRASLTRLRQSGFAIQMATTANGRRYVTVAAACGANH